MKTAKKVMLMLATVGLATLADAAEHIKPSSIPNCIVDLDASDLTTIVLTNDDTQVERWWSRTDNGLAFEHSSLNYWHEDFSSVSNDFRQVSYLPWYGATLFGGTKPGIRFGTNPSGDFQKSAIECNQLMPSNVTLFLIVDLPASQKNYYGEVYGPPAWGDQGLSFFKLDEYTLTPTAWQITHVPDASGWINGVKKYDSTTGLGPSMAFTPTVPHLVCYRRNSVTPSSGIDNFLKTTKPLMGVGSMHAHNGCKFIQCVIGELVVYDRRLTDRETDLVSASLMAKWDIDGGCCFWKGGSSGNWSDPANWTGPVPVNGEKVYIESAVHITVDTNVNISLFHAYDGGSLTVAKDKSFAVRDSVLVPSSGYVFSSAGATLSFPVESNLGDCASFSLTDTNTLAVAKGANFEFPATATVSGRLVLSDQGTVAFTADNQLGQTEVSIDSGFLDLNGTQQSFVGDLSGCGTLMNSSAQPATAVMTTASADEAVQIDVLVATNVVLKVPGPGTVKIGGERDHLNFSLGGGTLAAISNVPPMTISGCVVDLDAMALDSLVLTNDGTQVERWWSRTPNGLAFEHSSLNYWHEGFSSVSNDFRQVSYLPWYGASLMGGTRPGVRFGINPEGNFQKSTLQCNQHMPSNVTFFLVAQMPAKQQCDSAEVYGAPAWDGSGASYLKLVYSTSGKAWDTVYVADSSGWINGVKKYDSTEGLAKSLSYTAEVPHLLCFRRNSIDIKQSLDNWMQTCYPLFGVANMHVYCGCKFIQCVIGELIVYDRRLSDAEVDALQQWLMVKWGIAPDEVHSMDDSLGTNTTVTVTGAATYDMSLVSQSAAVMEYVKNADGVAPTLTVRGQMDLAKTELSLTGAAKTKSATLIENPDHGITGEFKNAATIDLGKLKLRHTDSRVRISGEGLIILFR